MFSAAHAWSLPFPAELLLPHCLWYYTYQMSAQCKQMLAVLQPPCLEPSTLHVAQGFLCWSCMKPVMVCKGCICWDFRLHESSHVVFNLCVSAVFLQHCSWADTCDWNCLLRLLELWAVLSWRTIWQGKLPDSDGEYRTPLFRLQNNTKGSSETAFERY